MKKRLLAGAALIVVALAVDLGSAPDRQWTTRAALTAIHGYQSTLSRVYTRMGVQCRFTPTCSHYSEACIQRFGAIKGGWMSAKRIVRCGPWTPMGTVDPPPA